MLVPVTGSLYVPGSTTSLDTVLVDVGTGYFIEKSLPEAKAFLERKIDLIKQQAGNVQHAIGLKQQHLQGTVNAINQKLMDAKQQQQAAA